MGADDEDDDVEMFFRRLIAAQKHSVAPGFVIAYLSVPKPFYLSYQISSFLDDRELARTAEELFAHDKKMELFDGVTATFGFDAFGTVSILDEKYTAELMVNSLGMVEYVKNGRRGTGSIGDGYYTKGSFMFRLYIPPSAVRDMIEKVTRFDRDFAAPEMADDDDGFLRFRLDISFNEPKKRLENRISYDIKSLYM